MLSRFILVAAIVCALLYINYLQFSYSAFYDPDSYYHIAVSRFIKTLGPHYQFRWAQFSTFKDSFADKDFFLHLLILPFLYVTSDPILAGKYAFILLSLLFILAYTFILKRYLPDILAVVFLFLPFVSPIFTECFLQLRSVMLANILMILGIYFLITKRVWYLCIISLLYPLTHISFFTMIFFALMCEAMRHIFTKEFFAKNITIVFSATILGVLIHPNFPHNLFSLYMNGMVVPLYAMSGSGFNFGGELDPLLNTRFTLATNIAVFTTLNIVAWLAITGKKKMSFASAVWAAAANIYLGLAFFSNRYWYQANILIFIFLASYARDCVAEIGWKKNIRITGAIIAIFFITAASFFRTNADELKRFMIFFSLRNSRLEETARWMDKNLPANETIYHSAWADAPLFICLNPKDNYINVLDPLYMYYRYPKEYLLLSDLSLGRVSDPYVAIRKIFKARYAYVNSYETPLLLQLNNDPKKFKPLYRNMVGTVFEVIDQ